MSLLKLFSLILSHFSFAGRLILCNGQEINNIHIHMPLVETQRVSRCVHLLFIQPNILYCDFNEISYYFGNIGKKFAARNQSFFPAMFLLPVERISVIALLETSTECQSPLTTNYTRIVHNLHLSHLMRKPTM